MDVAGVYHSHPESPAKPSSEDNRLAYDASISYVIVSLANGKEDIKSFRLLEKDLKPEEIEWIGS